MATHTHELAPPGKLPGCFAQSDQVCSTVLDLSAENGLDLDLSVYPPGTLISLSRAAKMLGVSRTTLWRFHKRHSIRVLTGRQVAISDMIRGIEAERQLGNKRTNRHAKCREVAQ